MIEQEPLSETPGGRAERRGFARFVAHALRPGQFLVIGGITGVFQLVLLAVLKERTDLGNWSNAVSFAAAAQLNFTLNYLFTWRDRMSRRPGAVVRQLVVFNALVGLALPLNQAIYLLAATVLPYLIAGAIGIGATTLGKYLVSDRWIFRRRHHPRLAA